MSENDSSTLAVIPKTVGFSLVPQTFAEFEKAAAWLSKSSMIPTALKDKPGDIMIAMEKLHQVGLNPIADLDSIAVINGRASIHSDGWLAVVQTCPGYLGEDDEWDVKNETAIVIFRRLVAGVPKSSTKTFSVADAKVAGLMGKDTWKNHPKKMAFWRARHDAGQVLFSDRLRGLTPSAVAEDYPSERAVATVEYVPQRKSEVVESEPVPEPHTPADHAAQKPAGESYVLSDVTVDASGKKDGAEWTIYKIGTVEGGDFYSKEADTADFARSLKGKAVRLAFDVRKGDRRVITHIEPIQE